MFKKVSTKQKIFILIYSIILFTYRFRIYAAKVSFKFIPPIIGLIGIFNIDFLREYSKYFYGPRSWD
jgi:hypothetical protein